MKPKKNAWYLAHEILSFEVEVRSEQEKCLIWENLILTRADRSEEAYEKAMTRGKLNDHPVTIDDRSGRCIFKGLKDLFSVYDELEDGAELKWKSYHVEWENVAALITPKEELQAFTPPVGSKTPDE